MKFTLQENQPYPVTISGSWLWLRYASAPIVMETVTGERVTIPQGSVIKNNELLGRVLLHSSESQTIDVEFGKGDFQPPSDGQRVVIELMPPMEIAPNQQVKTKVQPKSSAIDAQELTMPASLEENLTRQKITIRTPSDNAEQVLINGSYPLLAGELIEIESTAAIELTGAETDRVFILECHS
ncbi:hypothetical protein ACUALS_00220 [Vibrio sp. NH-7]